MRNVEALPLGRVPVLPVAELRERVLQAIREGGRIAALFAHGSRLYALIARDDVGSLDALCADVDRAYPSLTSDCPQAHGFEREIWELGVITPEGHPWLKPVRRDHKSFFRVAGDEVHEVAVGPVHAGIIEPGHFRFQCHGETVLHLEISLGYQHRGVEPALVGGPDKRTIHLMETLAGDTSIGHATAHAHLMEALTGTHAPARAHALRGIALELERLANHTGDLGALANDIGYLPTASYCGRLRGDWLNLTALLCGNRFGRGFVRVGGVGFDIGEAQPFLERLESAARDASVAVALLWKTSSVKARFEETGRLSRDAAIDLGLVGPAARASGVERDVRQDFPAGVFESVQIPVSTASGGDVFARAYVRWLEIQGSITFVRGQLRELPTGRICAESGAIKPEHFAVSLVEGWRGEICHVAITDAEGKFAIYKIVDPSFHNWFGLAMALRNQQISDFPLCNKSFNLSYCGHDL